jgi:hypothetical protein
MKFNIQDIVQRIRQMPENQLIALGAIVIGIVLILVAIVLML